jgi:predicted nucleic acid-binding protein
MEQLFCDTNALIRLLDADPDVVRLVDGRQLYISVMTEMEMQCNPNLKAADRLVVKALLDQCYILPLTDTIKDRAIKVRLSTRLKLVDAIVAASALVSQLPLVTADGKFGTLKNNITLILLPPR